MKNTVISILIALLALAGCDRRPVVAPLPDELVQAEALMYPHPDSALHILQDMPVPTGEEAKATWALLLTQARYKCIIDQSDSLLNIAYDYFMKGENMERKVLTMFCRGALYEEQKQMEDALTTYLKAADMVKSTQEYRIGYLIHVRTSMIYAHRELHEYSVLYAKKANEYALLSKRSSYIVNSYNCLARVYSAQKKFMKAIEYYDKAIEIGKEKEEWKLVNSASQEKMGIYIRLGRYKEAAEIARNLNYSLLSKSGLQTLGHLYVELNQPDSANYYLNKAIQSDNIYTVQSAYQALFNLNQMQKNYEESALCAVKLWKINDSINRIDRSKALIELQEKYDQQKVINEKNELELRKNQTIQRVLICLVIALATIAILIYVYQKKLQASKERIREYIRLQEENAQQIARNEQLIAELQSQTADSKEQQEELQQSLDALRQQTDRLKQENANLQGSIERYRLRPSEEEVAALRAQVADVYELKKQKQELALRLADRHDLVAQLRRQPKYLKPSEWAQLSALLDEVYDGFTLRLQARFPKLTEVDIQICLLLKLRFNVSQIGTIIAIAPSSVSVQKSRIKKRMQQTEPELFGQGELLDGWMGEF